MALVTTRLCSRLWGALFSLLVAVEAVHALMAGMLPGRVTDESTGNPVARAQVNVPAHDRSIPGGWPARVSTEPSCRPRDRDIQIGKLPFGRLRA